MKTTEERKEIAIERLMEYTGTSNYEGCWYNLDMILRILCGWDVIKNYDSKELHELIFEDENTTE